jgi:hypothetical protein
MFMIYVKQNEYKQSCVCARELGKAQSYWAGIPTDTSADGGGAGIRVPIDAE